MAPAPPMKCNRTFAVSLFRNRNGLLPVDPLILTDRRESPCLSWPLRHLPVAGPLQPIQRQLFMISGSMVFSFGLVRGSISLMGGIKSQQVDFFQSVLVGWLQDGG